ncbi:hypothetical protein A3L12_06320 [Thermococcus sp. P6]|uniref:hypothetical protein n=1 Tax=Thermococcus sp. P6 TaxID=122420 RepID=UPI000B59EA18|nr:hypothetical protein [Thermococcus sp. P6]ASJ10941.1 hypothetical protein A3L12_06320 [Thermococcus sp. P6]
MGSFTHIFVGIGNNGARVVNGIRADGVVRVTVNPAYYLLRPDTYGDRLRNFISGLPDGSFLWLVFEDTEVNRELERLIVESVPAGVIKLAYVLTPGKELVVEKKPPWAGDFETVFYDSLWDFLIDENASLSEAFDGASKSIAEMFSRLHYYLETRMLVNIDYADLFNIIKGGNVGILRLLRKVDFRWHWGIWERGLVGILVGTSFPLKDAHSILGRFQEILSEKDVIWGVITDEDMGRGVEILALLVRRW